MYVYIYVCKESLDHALHDLHLYHSPLGMPFFKFEDRANGYPSHEPLHEHPIDYGIASRQGAVIVCYSPDPCIMFQMNVRVPLYISHFWKQY